MASYLFIAEILQLYYRGPRKYFHDIFNYFDITSIVLPVITMPRIVKSFQVSNGFGNVDPDDDINLKALIAFSILVIWIQFVGFIL